VGKGESWTADQEESMPMIGKVKMKHECKLNDVTHTAKGETAVVGFAGKVVSAEPAAATAMGPIEMTFEQTEIQQSGTMKMDLKLGMVTDTDMDQTASIVMQMTPTQGQGAPMQMNISQKGKMKTQLRPGKYVPPTTKPAPKATTKPAKTTEF
jgi:hypothetical protein